MSSLTISDTNRNVEAKLAVGSADAVIVTKIDKMVEEIASISIDNLGALFRMTAQNANELRGLFGLLAEKQRKAFLEKAKEIKAIQSGWTSKASHLVNAGGSMATSFAGDDHATVKAAGVGASAVGGIMNSTQQAEAGYESAMQTALGKSLDNAYADVSRNQGQADQSMQMLDTTKSAMQAAKAALLR